MTGFPWVFLIVPRCRGRTVLMSVDREGLVGVCAACRNLPAVLALTRAGTTLAQSRQGQAISASVP